MGSIAKLKHHKYGYMYAHSKCRIHTVYHCIFQWKMNTENTCDHKYVQYTHVCGHMCNKSQIASHIDCNS